MFYININVLIHNTKKSLMYIQFFIALYPLTLSSHLFWLLRESIVHSGGNWRPVEPFLRYDTSCVPELTQTSLQALGMEDTDLGWRILTGWLPAFPSDGGYLIGWLPSVPCNRGFFTGWLPSVPFDGGF